MVLFCVLLCVMIASISDVRRRATWVLAFLTPTAVVDGVQEGEGLRDIIVELDIYYSGRQF